MQKDQKNIVVADLIEIALCYAIFDVVILLSVQNFTLTDRECNTYTLKFLSIT